MALASCPMSRNVLLSRNTGLHVHPSSPTPLLPRFHSGFVFQGVIQTLEQLPTKRAKYFYTCCHKAYATTVTDTPVNDLPTWAEFEMGKFPVFWKTSNGRPPASGESLTIFFNSAASSLVPNSEFGIAFNGGFNQPIMCGGQPRIMTKRDRGTKCDPLYTIKINVPLHALTLEFSFYDGKNWDGPYKLQFQRPAKWKNMPPTFFNKGLAEELSREGACESAIYPDAAYVQDRCSFPASLIHEAGKSCELDIVPGCTDQDSPFFNPLATVDDGSCSFNPDEFSEEEHV